MQALRRGVLAHPWVAFPLLFVFLAGCLANNPPPSSSATTPWAPSSDSSSSTTTVIDATPASDVVPKPIPPLPFAVATGCAGSGAPCGPVSCRLVVVPPWDASGGHERIALNVTDRVKAWVLVRPGGWEYGGNFSATVDWDFGPSFEPDWSWGDSTKPRPIVDGFVLAYAEFVAARPGLDQYLQVETRVERSGEPAGYCNTVFPFDLISWPPPCAHLGVAGPQALVQVVSYFNGRPSAGRTVEASWGADRANMSKFEYSTTDDKGCAAFPFQGTGSYHFYLWYCDKPRGSYPRDFIDYYWNGTRDLHTQLKDSGDSCK